MPDLVKVRDISLKYNISTRALKYYEDMGLIQSTRIDDYAYRCYDSQAVARLEQILILRKLDISIKNIVRIFASGGADILLEVLHKRVDDIDDQIVLLDDLKRFILDFIDSAEKYDFDNQGDIKRLYEQAHTMEERFDRASTEKALEISKKLEKAPVVSVVELPAIPMARCNDKELDTFMSWWQGLEKQYKPLHSGNLNWFNVFTEQVAGLYALPYGFDGECPYEVFDFPGGLYAVATFLDDPYPYAFESNTGYLYKWVGESEDYELYLTENDAQARFIMWRNKPSVGNEQPQVEFYVPIVRKGAQQKIHTKNIAIDEILGTEKSCRTINLRILESSGEIDMRFMEDGLQIYQQGQNGYCRTGESFRLPLRIDLSAKTDSTNIRMSFGQAVVLFNWGVAPNSMIVADVLEGGHYLIHGTGCLPPHEYAEISWIIERDYMAALANGRVLFVQRDLPYIQRLAAEPSLLVEECVRLHTAFGATVTVRKLEIRELA